MSTFHGPVGRSRAASLRGLKLTAVTGFVLSCGTDRRELRRGPALFSNIVTGLGTGMAMVDYTLHVASRGAIPSREKYKREVNVFWETLATSCLS